MTRRRPLLTTILAVVVAIPVIGLTHDAGAKKKKKGGGGDSAPADSGGGMTFEPETVERKDADAPAPTPTKSKPMKFSEPAARPSGPPPPAGQASKTLERALKLYDAEDYPMSSIELNKVVEGQSGDDEGNKQRAEFFMGKALFNLKF